MIAVTIGEFKYDLSYYAENYGITFSHNWRIIDQTLEAVN